MSGEQTEERDSKMAAGTQSQASQPVVTGPGREVAEALARVHEAVSEMKDGELRESVEAAIDAIDSTHGTSAAGEGDLLAPVADALEGALEELEKGKVANLLPVIEQTQSIVQPEPSAAGSYTDTGPEGKPGCPSLSETTS
jgi:hypothetical protein